MDATERKAFGIALIQNKELYEEVELYKKVVRFLNESVGWIISTIDTPITEEKSKHANILSIIQQAKKDWEKHYDAVLRQEYGISVTEATDIQREGHDHGTGMKYLKALLFMKTAEFLKTSACKKIIFGSSIGNILFCLLISNFFFLSRPAKF